MDIDEGVAPAQSAGETAEVEVIVVAEGGRIGSSAKGALHHIPARGDRMTNISQDVETAAAYGAEYAYPVFQFHHRPAVNSGIFQRLDRAIEHDLEKSADQSSADEHLLRSFLTWVLQSYDADRYAEIQRKHIPIAALDPIGRPLKYLNLPYFARRKVKHLRRLGLHCPPAKRILDIGCGSGHFQLMAGFFGHDCLGLDVPNRDPLYDALMEFFGVPKIDHRVEAQVPLPALPHKYDVVTSFLTQFDANDRSPWDTESWRFFIDDVRKNCLTREGILYITLTSAGLMEPVKEYLHSVAELSRNDRTWLIRNSP